MKVTYKVKEFAEYSTNNEQLVNEFLESIGNNVVSVTPLYNTILGGIIYVVVYTEQKGINLDETDITNRLGV